LRCFSNGEFQDVVWDDLSDKQKLVNWNVQGSDIIFDNNGYSDGKGERCLKYLPRTVSIDQYIGTLYPAESTTKGDYGEVVYGPGRKIYVGNEPFIIAFREKRSSNSDSLENNWLARIYAHKLNEDGTYTTDYNAVYYLKSDRRAAGYDHKFHHLDGSSSSNVSGTYDEWITNYITITPDSRYPLEYVTVSLHRFFSSTETWEGWVDNIWIGPADKFNPNMLGNEFAFHLDRLP